MSIFLYFEKLGRKVGVTVLQPGLDELLLGKELWIFYLLTVVVPVNYVSQIKMFIHVMLLQYIRIICLSISCRRSKYTSNYFPSCSILPYWKVQFRNHGYGHTSVTPLYCSNQSLRVAFPECPCNRKAISSSPHQIFLWNAEVCFSPFNNRGSSILYSRSSASLS